MAWQPLGEEGREEDVHVSADEEVVAGGLEVVVAVEGHEDRVHVAVVLDVGEQAVRRA